MKVKIGSKPVMSQLFGATGINKQTNLKIIGLHRQKSDTK